MNVDIGKAEQLLAVVQGIERTFHTLRTCRAEPAKYDKVGFGFNLDHRFSGAKITISLDTWSGYYGNSSCSRFLDTGNDELFQELLREVLCARGADAILAEVHALAKRRLAAERATAIAALEKARQTLETTLDITSQGPS